MLTKEEIILILNDVTYPGYEWIVGGKERWYIQAVFYYQTDVTDWKEQYTRKWYVSSHCCKSEVVHTALKCVLTSVEHEAREAFRYKGSRIFGPHFDVDELVKLCKERKIDVRPKETDYGHEPPNYTG